jgi:hypothetical protein
MRGGSGSSVLFRVRVLVPLSAENKISESRTPRTGRDDKAQKDRRVLEAVRPSSLQDVSMEQEAGDDKKAHCRKRLRSIRSRAVEAM